MLLDTMNTSEQLQRVRHHLRKLELMGKGEFPVTGNLDDEARGFFIECWHLKDYVAADAAIGRAAALADNYAKQHFALKRCGELAEAFKHARKNRNRRVRARFSTIKTTITIYPESTARNPQGAFVARVMTEDGDIDCLQLARACLTAWEEFFKGHGLTVG